MDIGDQTIHFPPPFTPQNLREYQDAFKIACAQAKNQEADAGHLFYVGRFDTLEFALVLEPDEPLAAARSIFWAAVYALIEALAYLSPPQKPLAFRYPATLLLDDATMGEVQFFTPSPCAEDEIPPFLVFGAKIQVHPLMQAFLPMASQEAGLTPNQTSLSEEAAEIITPAAFAAAFARHFMAEIEALNHEGWQRRRLHYQHVLASPPYFHAELNEKGDVIFTNSSGTSIHLPLADLPLAENSL